MIIITIIISIIHMIRIIVVIIMIMITIIAMVIMIGGFGLPELELLVHTVRCGCSTNCSK